MSNKVSPAGGEVVDGSEEVAKFDCTCGLARLLSGSSSNNTRSSNGAKAAGTVEDVAAPIDQDAFRNRLAASRRRSFIDKEKNFQSWELEQVQKAADARARRGSVEETKELGKLGIHKTVKFDDFKVSRTLGEGGFGKVLLVAKKKPREDELEPKQFAMKVLNKSFIIESGNVTRAIAEKDILQYIRHPFIVRLYYAFQTPEHLFLCMTYVGGGELYTLMETYVQFRQGGIPEKWAKFYAVEIALALHHLHLHGVLYRDLKPENIMLGLDGHVCITDFGLAMEYDEEEGMNEIAGTPCYICPDVLGDDPPTAGCDWWSYGVIVYELLFGKTPFGQGMMTVETVFHDIQHGNLSFPPETPDNTASFLNGILNRDTEARLGMGEAGFSGIEQHPFFSEYNFSEMLRKEVTAPYIPMEMKLQHKVDVTSIIKEKPKKKKS